MMMMIAATEFLHKISDIKAVLDADEQIASDSDDVDAEDMATLSDALETSECDRKHQQLMPRKFHRLKNEVPTRWNSRAHEILLLQYLRNFLNHFSAMTDLVSSKITSLSLIALIRAEIVDACAACPKDSDELKLLTCSRCRSRQIWTSDCQ